MCQGLHQVPTSEKKRKCQEPRRLNNKEIKENDYQTIQECPSFTGVKSRYMYLNIPTITQQCQFSVNSQTETPEW